MEVRRGSIRVQVLLSAVDKALFQEQAEREAVSLSGWLREAGRRRLAAEARPALRSRAELDSFFRACDERESGREPDWQEHLGVMAPSRDSGTGGA